MQQRGLWNTWRSILTPAVGALLLIAILIAVLVRQTFVAFHAHRNAELSVMRNYAEVAGDELVRRSNAQIGYDLYYRLLSKLQAAATDDPQSACQAPHLWAQDSDPALLAASAIASRVFVFDGQNLICESTATSHLDAQLQALREATRAHANSVEANRSLQALHLQADRGGASLIVAQWRQGWLGFAVDSDGLAGRLAKLVAAGAPTVSLGEVEYSLAALRIEVFDHTGDRLLVSGEQEPLVSVERAFGADYGGVFNGYRVRMGVPAALAQRVFGPVQPTLHTSYLLGLAGSAIALALIAVLQLRNERHLVALRADFVACVSHELRTPLTQISLYADTLLLGRSRTEQDREHALRVIQREARRLGHLIGNILRFSKQSGRTKVPGISVSRCDIVQVLDEAVEAMRLLAPNRKIVWQPDSYQRPIAAIDRDALHQALINLLDNAIKYSSDTAVTHLQMRVDDEHVRLTVDDQGPGIPATEYARIIQPYHRLARDQGSPTPGTGIGLAVVQNIASMARAELSFHDAPGGGTRVVLRVPLATGQPR